MSELEQRSWWPRHPLRRQATTASRAGTLSPSTASTRRHRGCELGRGQQSARRRSPAATRSMPRGKAHSLASSFGVQQLSFRFQAWADAGQPASAVFQRRGSRGSAAAAGGANGDTNRAWRLLVPAVRLLAVQHACNGRGSIDESGPLSFDTVVGGPRGTFPALPARCCCRMPRPATRCLPAWTR